jgi:hypothetical protein
VINIIEEKGKEKLYIANPMQMEIVIDSMIPVTKLTLNGTDTDHSSDAASLSRLGVKPCGYKSGELDFEMTISMTLGGENIDATHIETTKITKGFAEALWGVASATTDKTPSTPAPITGVMSGMRIKTKAPEAHYLPNFDFSKFLEGYNHANNEVNMPTLEGEESFNSNTVFGRMAAYQNTKESSRAIIAALKDLDMGFGAEEDDFEKLSAVEDVYKNGEAFFRGTPKLCKIGHKRHNPTDTI